MVFSVKNDRKFDILAELTYLQKESTFWSFHLNTDSSLKLLLAVRSFFEQQKKMLRF